MFFRACLINKYCTILQSASKKTLKNCFLDSFMQNSSSAFFKHALVRQPCLDGSWLARLLFTQDFAGSALWAFTAKKS